MFDVFLQILMMAIAFLIGVGVHEIFRPYPLEPKRDKRGRFVKRRR